MNLCDYLNERHATDGADAISAAFREEFGVKVRCEPGVGGGGLFQFKYEQLEAKWSRPLTHECRGAILRRNPATGMFSFVARPFNKFFALHEGYCALFEKGELERALPRLAAREKVDGTCIQVWWDEARGGGAWRTSTLATIEPMGVMDLPDLLFSELFWRVAGPNVTAYFDKGFTYVFEIAAPENRVVTKYVKPRACLLAARSLKTGVYLQLEELDDIVQRLHEKQGGTENIDVPFVTYLCEIGIKTRDDLLAWVEDEHVNPKYGEQPEGCVLYDGPKPLVKCKRASYISAHSLITNGMAHARNVIAAAMFEDRLDDILAILDERGLVIVEEIKAKIDHETLLVQTAWDEVAKTKPATRKDFAMAVKKIAPRNASGFFFLNNKEGEPVVVHNVAPAFRDWLKDNYRRREDLWKEEAAT
jgi:hypothetical protein